MAGRSRIKPKSGTDLDAGEEALVLLRILELGERNIQEGKTVPLAEAMRRLRQRLAKTRTKTRHAISKP